MKGTVPKDVEPVINHNFLAQVTSVPVAQNSETEWVDDFGDYSAKGTKANSTTNQSELVVDDTHEIVRTARCWDVVKTVASSSYIALAESFCNLVSVISA